MIEFQAFISAGFFKCGTQRGIGSHSSRNGKLIQMVLGHGFHGMPYQNIDHRFLERSCNIRLIYFNSFHFTGIEVIKHCGFQAAEAEIVGTPVYFRTREYNGIRIAFF